MDTTSTICNRHRTNDTPRDLDLPILAYLHVDFEHSTCAKFSSNIEDDAGFVLDVHESWPSLITSIIENTPQAVIIHLNALRHGPGSIAEISTMLRVILSLYVNDGKRHIGVVVDNAVDLVFVKELKKNNIVNIVPGVAFRGQAESTKAIMSLLAGEPYVIDVVEDTADLPRVISLWSKATEQPPMSVQKEIKDYKLYNIDFCHSWDQLEELLLDHTDLVLFHAHMCGLHKSQSPTEIVNMISSLVNFNTSTQQPKLAVVINPDTPVHIVKELRKTDVCGIVPSTVFWGIDVGTSAVHTILNIGGHWPKDIIASLPGNTKLPVKKLDSLPALTVRQQQVSDLVCRRGLSNKQIANTLKISESTVKIHISAVMKSYGVRNRTQLVLAAASALTP